MNKDIIAGKWTQLKGALKARWGQLTDDDFKVLQGDAQYLSGKLQERYGWDRDQADKAVSEFEHELRKQDKAARRVRAGGSRWGARGRATSPGWIPRQAAGSRSSFRGRADRW